MSALCVSACLSEASPQCPYQGVGGLGAVCPRLLVCKYFKQAEAVLTRDPEPCAPDTP